ncbi:DNA gyrase subunit A [compost metagenome]
MIINKSGIVIRISVEELRVMGRATQGVRLINLKGDDEIASITKVDREDEEEEIIATEDGEIPTTEDGETSTEITETDQDEKSESNEE